MPLITCENASFAYEGHIVIDRLNVEVQSGEYLCIVGENGSGKSTLVKGLLNLLAPVHGKVVYGNGLQRNEIGYLPQRSEMQKDFPASVYEVVTSGCRNKSLFLTKDQKAKANEMIDLLGITQLKRRSFIELSGGQQQRALLARALCATKTALLLDEPVAGLDPLVTKEMYDIIQMLNQKQGLTIIMVSHDINAALRYADRILHMTHHKTFLGTPTEYRQSPLGFAFASANEGGGDDD